MEERAIDLLRGLLHVEPWNWDSLHPMSSKCRYCGCKINEPHKDGCEYGDAKKFVDEFDAARGTLEP